MKSRPLVLLSSLLVVAPFAVGQSLTVTDGLQLWLRADAGVTTSASSAVTEWADQSGQENHAVQFDETWAPVLVEDAINGHPALRFDGTDDFLEVFDSESISIAGDLTTFFVVRYEDFSVYQTVWAKTLGNLPAPTDHYLLPGSGVPRLYRGNGASDGIASFDGRAVRSGAYLIVGFECAGDGVTHFVGSVPTATGSLSVAPADGDASLYIGTRGDFFTKLKGDLAELVIYDRALPAEEREAVVEYLAEKYDIRNEPPAVELTAEPPGPDLEAGTMVRLTADAEDPDGQVARVEFLINGGVFATAVAWPFAVSVVLETAGDFEVVARAVDDKDAIRATTPIMLRIAASEPPPLTATNHLQLWLRADAGVTTGVGDAVTAWADQSAAGHEAIQTDEAMAPVLVQDAVAGLPALRFDGVDDFLDVPDSDALSIAGDISSWFVVKVDDFATYRAVWAKTLGNLPAPTDYYLLPGSGVPRLYRGNGEGSLGSVDGGTALRAGVFELAGFESRDGSVTHHLNGRVTSAGTIAATLGDQDTSLRIGSRDDFGTRLAGEIAELLIYDAALSAEERRAVEVYLAGRYGIGLFSVSNTPPAVTLTAPAPGSSVAAPAEVTLEAEASDSDGSIARVDFLVNGVVVGSASSAPFRTTIEFSAADNPEFAAEAVDNLGGTARSSPVTIQVISTAQVPLPAPAHLKVWLRADAGVTEDGGLVREWQDQSGNLNHASQPEPDLQPYLTPDAINGRPAVWFDGIDDFLSIPHHFSVAMVRDISSYFVVRLADLETFRTVWSKAQGNQPRATDYYILPQTGIPRALRGGVGAGSVDGVNPLNPGEFVIAGFEMEGTTMRHILNGAPNGEGEITVTLADTGRPLLIGTRDNRETILHGEIAELIIYNKALSAGERAGVMSYLAEKYGIEVAAPPPEVAITRAAGQVTLSWSPDLTGAVLEASETLEDGGMWQEVPGVTGSSVTIDIEGAARFFRLVTP